MEAQLKEMGWWEQAQRFPAVHRPQQGNIGCTMSHIRCLTMAMEREWPHVIILEDDFYVHNIDLWKENVEHWKQGCLEFDVLLLSGNNGPPFHVSSEHVVQVRNCQTTTGYVVNKHYMPVLLQNMKHGLERLIREPKKGTAFALDIYWKHLQQTGRWFLLVPVAAVQLASFSDIENRHVDYSHAMVDWTKHGWSKEPRPISAQGIMPQFRDKVANK